MPYQAVILTVSDSCAAGTRTDTSGPAIRAMLENAGFAVQAMQTVPDEEGQISAAIVHACDILQADLVVTTGGTGLSPRDVTPEATLAVLDREIRAIPVNSQDSIRSNWQPESPPPDRSLSSRCESTELNVWIFPIPPNRVISL